MYYDGLGGLVDFQGKLLFSVGTDFITCIDKVLIEYRPSVDSCKGRLTFNGHSLQKGGIYVVYGCILKGLQWGFTIMEAGLLIQTLGDLPGSYRDVARYVLNKICKNSGKEIHVIFIRYFSPSIKDLERIKRSGDDFSTGMYSSVMQPHMIRPSNFTNTLRTIHFK